MKGNIISDKLNLIIESDNAIARDYVFQGVSTGSRRGWNYILEYNRWLGD